uniref:VTT domain-containing protein n=1 Tax=Pseudo-nitzschia australis TaxID=44445 RepID=A0A7S4EQQ7_9STRA|mmetsp:Transcript_18193/g.39656  ORF Transcript_18193/g.39656 Transcript_18193/m.39656 type:complete len:595 (-) Transcript_18193:138-1922(-)
MSSTKKSFVELSIKGKPVGTLDIEQEQPPLPLPKPLTRSGKSKVTKRSLVELTEKKEPPLPPPEPLTRRDGTNETQRSFVELTINGETVGSLETTQPPQILTLGDETDGSDGHGGRRRNLVLSAFSGSIFNIFKSQREKDGDLTAKLQQQEEDSLSSASAGSGYRNSSSVPYANFGGPHSQFLQPQQQQYQSSPQVWNSIIRSHNRNESSLHNHEATNKNNKNNNNDVNANNREEDFINAASCNTSNASRRLKEFTTEFKSLLVDLIEYGKAKTWKKKLLTVILCGISALVFYDLFYGKQDCIVTQLHSFVVWMTTHHTAAVFAFVGIFVLSTLAFVPPTLLVFGAGYAFTVALDNVLAGVTAATISCFLGSCIGAILAFLRSRYMMRDLVKLFANRYPLVRAVDQALKVKHGLRIMLLLRFCPIIPYNALNYCCGITGVRLYDFTLSLVGILPFQIYTIILGATAGAAELQNLKNDDYTKRELVAFIVFIATGVIFGLIAIVYAWYLVKHELKRELSLSTVEFESMIRPSPSDRYSVDGGSERRASPSLSYHLQDDDNLFHDTASDKSVNISVSTTRGVPYREEGEEWFWMWS